jgi:hypothetical protein
MSQEIEEMYPVKAFFLAFGKHEVEAMLAPCTNDARLRFVPMGDVRRLRRRCNRPTSTMTQMRQRTQMYDLKGVIV